MKILVKFLRGWDIVWEESSAYNKSIRWGTFLYTKVCKKSRQWKDFCIVMHSEEAVGGRYCRYINITGEENGKKQKRKTTGIFL